MARQLEWKIETIDRHWLTGWLDFNLNRLQLRNAVVNSSSHRMKRNKWMYSRWFLSCKFIVYMNLNGDIWRRQFVFFFRFFFFFFRYWRLMDVQATLEEDEVEKETNNCPLQILLHIVWCQNHMCVVLNVELKCSKKSINKPHNEWMSLQFGDQISWEKNAVTTARSE